MSAICENHELKEIEHCWIPMPDGVRLSARLWLPVLPDNAPAPAILEYIPYRKRDMVRLRDERNHPVFARHGYACVRVDMRGSGDSEGLMTDMYGEDELDDAIRIIEWIAGQTWCSGAVGMMGTSWGGTSALQAAARRPIALKAIIAVCATNNRYEDDIHHMGGCLLTDSVEWGVTLPVILASPPDPETVGPGWRELWMERLENLSFPLENWVKHEIKDDYWRWGAVSEKPDAITCPVLMIGGWVDRYSNTVMNLLAQSHHLCWGIVGPWGHHYPDQGNPGPAIGFQQEALRWWGHWLRSEDNGIESESRLRVWRHSYCPPQDKLAARPGRWIAEQEWPSQNIYLQTLWLTGAGLRENPANQPHTVAVPTAITGEAAGDTGYFGREGGLPLDQQVDDDRSLVFESLPLSEPIDLLGRIQLRVEFKSDQPIATLVARVNDVPPEGPVARVTYGVRNLALNDTLDAPLPLEPGVASACMIDFHNMAYRFKKGHRVRLAISTNYWPIIWPSPVTPNIRLHLDAMHLQLPLRKPIQDKPAISLAGLPVQRQQASRKQSQNRNTTLSRRSKTDCGTGIRCTEWHQPPNQTRFPGIDLSFGHETRAQHRLSADTAGAAIPDSLSSSFTHELNYSREGWRIRVIGAAELKSTEKTFELKGSVKVLENHQEIYHREWDCSVPRRFS